MMGLPDDSWHIRYFEYSYIYYITFTFVIVMIYSVFYCVRASATPFGTLRDIVDKDPVIDGFITDRTPMSEVSQKVVFNPCLTVPHHNLTSVKRKQAKGAIEIEDQQNLRNRKVGGDTNKKKKRDPYKIPKGTTRKSSNTTIGSSTHSLGPGSKSSSIDHFSSNIDISEQLSMTQTRQIEKMVDDITNKLQEKADDIITIHVSDVYLHSK